VTDAIRVAIVDNDPIFRDGVAQALRKQKNLVIVALGSTAKEAVQFADAENLDILLVEVAVPGSLRAAQAIMQAHSAIKIVFLASTDDQELADQALRGGAHGYIVKGITGTELIAAIETIHGGKRYITPDLAWLAARSVGLVRDGSAFGKRLSVREQQVLDHTSKGLTNQEIATVLGLTVSTIKYYKTLAFRKVGARNRLEAILAVKASRQG
jgi:DNA-binding NarL/FixJ family response regulator